MSQQDPFTKYPPDAWLTDEQIVEARPSLSTRLLRTWAEGGKVRFSKSSDARSGRRLFRLMDVDAFINSNVVEPTRGPLARKAAAR